MRLEVESALKKNDIDRNNNLEKKLFETKEAIVIHINKRINEIPIHQTSPETRAVLNAIKENCNTTSNRYHLIQELMQRDIKEIKEYIKEDKEWKENTWNKIENKFLTKTEFSPYKTRIDKLIGALWVVAVGGLLIVIRYVLNHVGLDL